MSCRVEFSVRGRVVGAATGQPLGGLRVVALGRSAEGQSILLSDCSDAAGWFSLELSRDDLMALFRTRTADGSATWRPDCELEIAVWNGNLELTTQRRTVRFADAMASEAAPPLSISVASTRPIEIVLEVRVRTPDARAVSGLVVVAIAADQGSATLASATTGRDGTAALRVAAGTATPTDSGLRLRIAARRGAQELVSSPVLLSPAQGQRIELVVEDPSLAPRSEFEALLHDIQASAPERGLADLAAAEVERIAAEADVFPPHLGMLVRASRLAVSTDVAAAIWYALLRAGLPTTLTALLVQRNEVIARALRRGYDEHIIPAPRDVEREISTTLARLRALVVGATLAPEAGAPSPLGAALMTTGLPAARQARVLEHVLEHEGSLPELWSVLRRSGQLTATEIDTVEFTLTAAALVNHHLPALEVLQARRRDGEIARIADLAAWDADAWTRVLDGLEPPDDVPGRDRSERARIYAEAITRIVEELHPTATLRHRLERDRPPRSEGVAGFLRDHPGFRVESTPVDVYLADHPDAAPTDDAGRRTIDNLRAVARLHQLAPRLQRYDVTRVLLEAGFESAAAIVHRGADGFVDAMSARLEGAHPQLDGAALARTLFDAARVRHGLATALLSRHGAAFADTTMAVLPMAQLADDDPATATLRELFGALDYCACEHCRSMYGPAAYFVAMLAMLEGRPAVAAGRNALDVLRDRRPDLTGIELSCANTNTQLPYIDLVLELLEQLVVNPAGPLAPRQTTWRPAELRTGAEHRLAAAYDAPAQALFPWRLPFDLPLEELRTSMRQLGVPRLEAMQTLQRRVGPPIPSPPMLVAEALGVTPLELQIISDATAFSTALFPEVPGDVAWGMSGNPIWAAELSEVVPSLLARAGLTYDGLLEALALPFIDPSGQAGVRFDEPSCDLADARVEGFSTGVADRLHRFVRLQRATGLAPDTLDRAIRVLGGGVLDAACLRRLADMLAVGKRLRASADALFCLWGPLDTRIDGSGSSPYHRLFQNRQVTPELDPAFACGSGATELTAVVPLADVHLATLRAALGITEAELGLLIGALLPPAPLLDLANLSLLERHARLARAARLSIVDLLRLRANLPGTPFAPHDPEATAAFLDELDRVRSVGVSAQWLDAVLRHRFASPDSDLAPSTAAMQATLDTIVAASAAIDVALASIEGDPPARTRALLSMLPAAVGSLDEWRRILDLANVDVTAADTAFLALGFATFTDDPDAAVTALAALAGLARYEFVVELALAHLRLRNRRAALSPILAAFAGLAAEAVDPLAGALLHVGGVPLTDVLLDAAFLEGTGDRGAQLEALARLHKAVLVVRALDVRTEDLRWYFDGGAPQALDLDALPLAPIDSGVLGYAGLRRVQLGIAASAGIDGPNPFREASAAVDLDAAIDRLVERTGWSRDDLAFACGPDLLGGSPATFADPDAVTVILRALDLVRRTGVGLPTLAQWVRLPPTAARADATVAALRTRYSDAQWPEVITPIVDRLRERQRDALVDLLVARGDFDDDDDLYRRLLVDVRTNAKVSTSRIRLALSVVQLFISRVLMQLESSSVVFPPETAERWSWMKNYRVWEANQKVFFYPENWVEPELRDDKSPFFVELEQQLGQAAITDATAETALRDYLRKLHEVAHLQTIALFRDAPSEGGETVHVLARTRSLPHRYFHRTRIDDRAWTPWVAVPVDIPGDHVALVVHNRRLFVFWCEFVKESVVQATNDASGIDDAVRKASPPTLRYRVRIGWSERRDGGWAPKQLTQPSKGYHPAFVELDEARFSLVAYHAGPAPMELRLDVIRRIESRRLPAYQFLGGGWFDAPDGAPLRWNETFVRFLYDDCRDELDEYLGALEQRTDGDLGMGYDVVVDGQRHRSTRDDDGFDVLYYDASINNTEVDANYVHVGLLRNLPHRYHVVAARQLPRYPGDTPLVFDDADHAFYVAPTYVPRWIEPEGAAPGSSPAALTSSLAAATAGTWSSALPGPAPTWERQLGADRPVPTTALRSAPAPFGGRLPGKAAAVIEASATAVDETPLHAVLASTQALAVDDLGVAGVSATAEPLGGMWIRSRRWRIDPFHHPFTCTLLATLNRYGIEGLYHRTSHQLASNVVVAHSGVGSRPYLPSTRVVAPDTRDDYDFTPGGAYSVYNWELFFHVPLLLAEKLRKEQRFEEAQRWYHFVFNPVAGSTPDAPGVERFWNIKPFFVNARDGLPDIIRAIFQDEGLDAPGKVVKDFLDSVLAWFEDPFSPHAIARVRPGTYEKVVVRKYLDNLIDWADSLFRRDTIESINEATQLYLLAAGILGPRPRRLSPTDPPVRTYDDLTLPMLFGGLTQLENFFVGELPTDFVANVPHAPPAPPVWWYFCLPANDQLLAYWDTVADRLFKIRNSMNIEGVERQLALFEPPIDPALLVRARAAGVDIGAAAAGLGAPLPHHRYAGLFRRAVEVCNEVRGLGSALLSALEKKDAERLALLRQQHEIALLESNKLVRALQIEEAQRTLEGLRAQRETVLARQHYYDSREKHSGLEKASMALGGAAAGVTLGAQILRTLAGALHIIPDFDGGLIGPLPKVTAKFGGSNVGPAMETAAGALEIVATQLRYGAELTSTLAGYQRRYDDWQFQAGQAKLEVAQLDKQILAAEIRTAVTQRELATAEQQIEQSKATDELMRSKFTNEQLYDWMIGQIATVHFGAYKLAFDLAKKAERALQFELGRDDLSFIEFGAWDGLRRGLLAGEVLGQALRRMDAAYVDHDRRWPELTRRISLRQIDANALLELQASGSCTFALPEVLFDLDHPGMYMRRIKAVSVSLMATVGPHTSVGGRLTLLSDWIRRTASLDGGYPRSEPAIEDPRFSRGPGGVQSIATSRGRDDAGVFQLDFRDERYLPFEGAGAISEWRFDLPEIRQYDYAAISDLEIQIQYTARDGGDAFRAAASAATQAAIASTVDALNELGMYLLLRARTDFASAWERFLRPVEGEASAPLALPIQLERFPYVARARGIVIDAVELVFVGPASAVTLPTNAAPAGVTTDTSQLAVTLAPGAHGRVHAAIEVGAGIELVAGAPPWSLSLGDGGIADADVLDDLAILIRYHTAT